MSTTNKFSFESLDMFGMAVALKFAGSGKSKSRHGTLFTVLFALFVIWAFFYSASKLITRTDPKTITYDSFQQDPSEMTISKKTFPFALGLKHNADLGFDHFRNESLFQIEIAQVIQQTIVYENGTHGQVTELIPLDVEICTPESFGELSSSFTSLPLQLLYCIKEEQTYVKDIKIKGNMGSAVFQAIGVSVKKCDNATFNGACATTEEIESILNPAYFQIYYAQLAINPTNSSHPDFRFRQDQLSMVSPRYYKTGQVTLSHVSVSSDYGWIVEDKQSKDYIQVTNMLEDLDLRPNQFGYLYDLLIFVDQLEKNYERNYIKLQDVLAQVQGLATTAILIILFVLKPYSKVKFHETLINELFDVKMRNHEKAQESKKEYYQEAFSSPEISPRSEDFSPRKETKILIEIPNSETRHGFSRLHSEAPVTTETQNNAGPETKRDFDQQYLSIPPPSSSRNFLSSTIQNPNSHQYSTSVVENKAIKKRDVIRQSTLQERLAQKELISARDTLRDPVKNKTYIGNLTGNAQKAQKVENKDLTDIEGDIPNLLSFNSENSFIKEIKEDAEEVLEKKIGAIPATDGDLKENHDEGEGEGNDGKGPNLPEEVLSPKSMDKEIERIHTKFQRKNTSIGYESKRIHISFWEYLNSFVRKTEASKEKIDLLKKGVKNIEERLDIFNILKKFREIDKLKALLLEHDQLMLFNAMPKPEIKIEDPSLVKKGEFSRRLIKSTKFIEGHENNNNTITSSFQNIALKSKKSKIDRKLLEIFEDSWAP